MEVYKVHERMTKVYRACLQSTENHMQVGNSEKQFWFALNYLNNPAPH